MSSSVNPVSSSTATEQDTSSQSATTKKDELTDKTAFLKLLVAQIKNQDPLSPADGTQFLSQLVQFSQVEQLIGINESSQQLLSETQQLRTATEQMRDVIAPQPDETTETDTQPAETAA